MEGAIYLRVLEEFLVEILEEEGPNIVLFPKDGAGRQSIFPFAVGAGHS